MEILDALMVVFTLETITMILLGVFAGIIIGALPGLTVNMGIALLLPLTYSFQGMTGILLLLGMYCGAVYGGSITAILISTPGTPASAATVLDGYKMAKKGELWFHAKDIPGSHVLIKDNLNPSDEVKTDAAELAAYYSKARLSNLIQVDMIEAKKLNKPTGAKPGFVTYTGQKTLRVTPTEEKINSMRIENKK